MALRLQSSRGAATAVAVILAVLASAVPSQARDAGSFLEKASLPAALPADLQTTVEESTEDLLLTKKAAPEDLMVRKVSQSSYSDQIKQAFFTAILGIVLFVLGFPVLYYNEKREVHMDKLFKYAEQIIKENVPCTPVDSQYEGNLVHMNGETAVSEVLRDSDFGISVSNSVKLVRSTEMYAWVENESQEERDIPGGGKETITTYTYSMQWTSSPADSSSFQEPGHNNPVMACCAATYAVENVAFGDFQLTESLIRQMVQFQPLAEGELQPSANVGRKKFQLQGGTYVTNLGGGQELGDMRVTFQKVPCGPATVVSLQHGRSFTPLTFDMVPAGGCCPWDSVPKKVELTEALLSGGKSSKELPGGIFALCKCVGILIESGESLDELAEDTLSFSSMVARAKASQACIRIGLKIAGFLLFYLGLYMQFSFFPTFFRVVPLIGTWIQWFGNLFASLSAFFLGCFFWCLTVSVAWMVLRPLKGILFFCLAISMLCLPSVLHQHMS